MVQSLIYRTCSPSSTLVTAISQPTTLKFLSVSSRSQAKNTKSIFPPTILPNIGATTTWIEFGTCEVRRTNTRPLTGTKPKVTFVEAVTFSSVLNIIVIDGIVSS